MATLTGVRVVEFTHMVAGPACGQVLADLGAEVIKVEPERGDITRSLGPKVGDTSALFASSNRGKRSVRLDLRRPEDAETALALVKDADVLISNIDGAMLTKAGLTYEALSAVHPGLIWVEVSAFGPEGPLGTDGIAQASAGLMSITGEPDGGTYRTGATVVDVSTGVWAALGVLAALENRRQSGRGDRLSISLHDVCLYMQLSQLALYRADPASVRRNGNHSMISCTPIFETADGRLMTTILHDRHWAVLCDLLGRPDLKEHPDFADNARRCERQSEIERLLNPAFAARTRAEWAEALRAERIPCGPERRYEEVVADADLHAQGQLFDLPAPGGGRVLNVAMPVRFQRAAPAPRPASALGEGDAEILDPLREGKKE